MVNITLNTKSRSCIASSTFLGYEGENGANKLVFEFMDEFVDGSAQLNIKRGNDNGYVALVKVGETYELEVKSSLVSQIGDVTFQLQVSKTDGTIYKYDAFVMTVKDAIDSDIPLPEDYPTWQEAIATALAQVENLDIFATKVDNITTVSVTDKNGVVTEVEIHDGADGKDGVDGTSSEISVKTDTDAEYVLTIKDKNGSFDTPNLKGKDAEFGGITEETDPIYLADKPNLALKKEIPTKTSELINDSSFATETFVTNKIAEAELSGGDVDLSGYATKDELNKKADAEDIPTKVSELTNDSNYITSYTETDPTVPSHVKAITEADITNWNNKQDVLTAGNNITIENGVISASGSGEGGLAELPIATSEVLGGIKVGEGLEITEDGVLSALGRTGEVTTLFKGWANTVNSTYQLSDNIEQFDLIIVTGGHKSGQAVEGDVSTMTIPVILAKNKYGTTFSNGYTLAVNRIVANGTEYFIRFSFANANNLYIVASDISQWSDVAISGVYGIKLGSSGGSRASQTVLFEGSASTEGEIVTLSESIENFDQLILNVEYSDIGKTFIRVMPSTIIDVEKVKAYGYNNSKVLYQGCNYVGTDVFRQMIFNFTANNKILISDIIDSTNSVVLSLTSVVGIKLGSSGGSSYKESELLNSPLIHEITNANQSVNFYSDIALNESVNDYDTLVFTFQLSRKSDGVSYHKRFATIQTSNIVFANSSSDADALHGAHFGLEFGAPQLFVTWAGWFKTDKTLMLQNIFYHNTLDNNALFNIKLCSIKGIKY